MANKKTKYQKLDLSLRILKELAIVGAATGITVAMALMPGLPLALYPFLKKGGRENQERFVRNRVNQTIWKLKERGWIKKDKEGTLSLTEKGAKILRRYQWKELTIKKPRRWDGKWRLVIFDVWETRKPVRDLLRSTLMRLGFLMLQESVWVYPYECEELIGLLRTELKASPAIQYMIVERMDRDYWLRKAFNLPFKKHYL